MNVVLYETTMQVVPLLLIALFLDRRPARVQGTEGSRTYERVQNRIFLVLGLAGFMTSLLVVSGVVHPGDLTAMIVRAALGGCMFLLCTQIWRRFNRQAPRPAGRETGPTPAVPAHQQTPSP
jgi:hypothetical protein